MDHYARSARNTFAGLPLNRKSHCLDPSAWEECLFSEQAAFVVVRQDEILFDHDRDRPRLLSAEDVAGCLDLRAEALLLGTDAEKTYFAISSKMMASESGPCLESLGRFEKLRQFSAVLPPHLASLLGYARCAAEWNTRVNYCAFCAAPTRRMMGSLAQVCTNPDCRREYYPRVDPAVIVLVYHEDSCLLGRQLAWRPKVYSALSGYVEPGESVEDAVLREILEETGIRVTDVRYRSSQPWPFSGSLMLGFFARAENTDIRMDEQELEDARWFSRQELPDLLERGVIALPGEEAIAWHLFMEWYKSA